MSASSLVCQSLSPARETPSSVPQLLVPTSAAETNCCIQSEAPGRVTDKGVTQALVPLIDASIKTRPIR